MVEGNSAIAIVLLLAVVTIVGVAALVGGDGGPGGDGSGWALTDSDPRVPTQYGYAEEYRELLQTIPSEIARRCEATDNRDEGVAANYQCRVNGLTGHTFLSDRLPTVSPAGR